MIRPHPAATVISTTITANSFNAFMMAIPPSCFLCFVGAV
jgi:hypothetical protein